MNNIFSEYITEETVLIGEVVTKKSEQTELFTDDQLGTGKKTTNKPAGKDETSENNDIIPIENPEFTKLKERSANSLLVKHLQTQELNQLKIENERILFLKNAGKVAEIKFMEFLYFGYMEKANLDLMKMVKKLKVRFEPLVSQKALKEIIEILSNEISYVLTSIKKKQAEEVKNWKDDLR